MTDVLKAEIAVIGAGPGGATASLTLSSRGIPHLLIDKSEFPRDKVCGDACSGKVVDLLREFELNFDQEEHRLPSWGVTFVAPNGKALRVPFQPDMDKTGPAPGFISKRIHFDAWLAGEAVSKQECAFHAQVELRQYRREEGKWICSDRKGNDVLIADHLIVADGAQSAFARTVAGHEQDPSHHAAGIRAYYCGVTGMDSENFIELHFLEEFIPGYLWIFPLPDGMANVGIGLRTDLVSKRKLDLKKKLQELIEDHEVLRERFRNAELIGDIRGFGLPFGSRRLKISGDGYVLVGDAGSLIDPFTGEGIGNAMISGKVAGEVLAASVTSGHKDLSAYDEGVYRKLGKELDISTKLQHLANRKWLFNWLINKATTNKALGEMISNMFMDLDIRDRLKQPSFYFKLLVD